MLKVFLSSIAVAVAMGGSSVPANAQQAVFDCGCCGGVQTYQRYSFQPTVTSTLPSAPVIMQPLASAPAPDYASPGVQPQIAVNQAQSYRRYSYQPAQASVAGSARSSKRKPWDYPKADYHRYRP
jgi:hypothetical protein